VCALRHRVLPSRDILLFEDREYILKTFPRRFVQFLNESPEVPLLPLEDLNNMLKSFGELGICISSNGHSQQPHRKLLLVAKLPILTVERLEGICPSLATKLVS